MKDIHNLNYSQLEEYVINNSIPKFRTKQIWDWLYKKHVNSFDEMTNLDKKTLNLLSGDFLFNELPIVKELVDSDKTEKSLLRLEDGELIETVLMPQRHGYSVCVTTQVGCKMGCSFCASQINGFKRNLETHEIVKQVMYWDKKLASKDERVSHVVVMGIGEPFDNYDNVINFIDIINDPLGLKIGARHITISTSGIVPGIEKLSDYPKQVNLAISLHAPNNPLRNSLMQINNKYPIEEVMLATNKYIRKTNRRISFEYIMIKGVNDSLKEAEELVNLVFGMNCHINLIPFNSVDEFNLSKSDIDTIMDFEDYLKDNNIQVSTRTPKGENIDGACGQLRHKNV